MFDCEVVVLGRVVVLVGRLLMVGRLVVLGRLAVLGRSADGRAVVEGLAVLPLMVGRELPPLTLGRVDAPAPVFLGLGFTSARWLIEPGVLLRRTWAT